MSEPDLQAQLARARERGREEAMAGMRRELDRLAAVEVWARRIIGNALVWATDAKAELDSDADEFEDHSYRRPALRHAGGHLRRAIELLSQPLPAGFEASTEDARDLPENPELDVIVTEDDRDGLVAMIDRRVK